MFGADGWFLQATVASVVGVLWLAFVVGVLWLLGALLLGALVTVSDWAEAFLLAVAALG